MQSIETLIEDAVARAVAKAFAEQGEHTASNTPAISVKDAAKLASVSTATIYDWTHRDDCDFCIPVGRNKKILRHKFIKWLERQAGEKEAGS